MEKEKEPTKESKEPKDIDKKDLSDQVKLRKWKESCKKHCDKIEEHGSGKKKLCTSLWGQCTQIMQNEPQAVENFEEMDEDQDPMALIKNVEKLTNDFRDKRCVFGGMWHTQKQLCNCAQKDDKDIKKHCDRVKNQVEIIETMEALHAPKNNS